MSREKLPQSLATSTASTSTKRSKGYVRIISSHACTLAINLSSCSCSCLAPSQYKTHGSEGEEYPKEALNKNPLQAMNKQVDFYSKEIQEEVTGGDSEALVSKLKIKVRHEGESYSPVKTRPASSSSHFLFHQTHFTRTASGGTATNSISKTRAGERFPSPALPTPRSPDQPRPPEEIAPKPNNRAPCSPMLLPPSLPARPVVSAQVRRSLLPATQ